MVDVAGGKMLRAFGHLVETNWDSILDVDGSSLIVAEREQHFAPCNVAAISVAEA